MYQQHILFLRECVAGTMHHFVEKWLEYLFLHLFVLFLFVCFSAAFFLFNLFFKFHLFICAYNDWVGSDFFISFSFSWLFLCFCSGLNKFSFEPILCVLIIWPWHFYKLLKLLLCFFPHLVISFVFFFNFYFNYMCIQCLGHFFPIPPNPFVPPPTPSIPGRNYFALISNFVEERV
jgi:hypothetical protein